MSGTLFLVATPIGNLEDITLRALRVLKEVAVIAAEDTRRTGQLLRHFGITTPTVSLHAHNEFSRTPSLVTRLLAGESVAVVTDAGSPGVSDPGMLLAAAARTTGCRVEAVPGPSAVIAALTSAGIPLESGFTFVGFLPPRTAERAHVFGQIAEYVTLRAVVAFEAPHRVRKSLEEALNILGNCQIVVARELTKMHESVLSGSISEVLTRLTVVAGEFTLVFPRSVESAARESALDETEIYTVFCRTTENNGGSLRSVVRAVAAEMRLPVRIVYDVVARRKAAEADRSG